MLPIQLTADSASRLLVTYPAHGGTMTYTANSMTRAASVAYVTCARHTAEQEECTYTFERRECTFEYFIKRFPIPSRLMPSFNVDSAVLLGYVQPATVRYRHDGITSASIASSANQRPPVANQARHRSFAHQLHARRAQPGLQISSSPALYNELPVHNKQLKLPRQTANHTAP